MKLEVKKDGVWTDVTSYIVELNLNKNGGEALDFIELKLLSSIESEVLELKKGVEFRLVDCYSFGGKAGLIEKAGKGTIKVVVYSYGEELLNIIVNEVYYNQSPEEIIQDLISNYTGLTYASTETSGITIEKIVFKDKKLVEAIRILADILDWVFWTDKDKKFYFESKGKVNSGVVLEDGVNIAGTVKWKKLTDRFCNHILFEGGEQTFNKKEEFTGDGSTKEFTLSYKPTGSVRVLVDGTEKSPEVSGATTGDYSVDGEAKKIVFNTAPANSSSIEVYYTYSVPIKIEAKNTESIINYNADVMKKVKNKAIKTFSEARKYVQKFLSLYSEPLYSAELEMVGYDNDLEVGRIVEIIDNRQNKNESLIITRLIYNYPKNTTRLICGANDFLIWDWQKEVLERLKQLEAVEGNVDIIQKYLSFRNSIDIEVSNTKLTIYSRNIEYDTDKYMLCLDYDYTSIGGALDNSKIYLDGYASDDPDNANSGWVKIREINYT